MLSPRLLRCARALLGLLGLLGLLALASPARGEELPEYRLKAAFLYNFALLTEWPATVGQTLNLCVHGRDPFAGELDGLQGKVVGGRRIAVQRPAGREALNQCQILFVAASAIDALPRVLESLHRSPVLTVADSAGAAQQGVAINMAVGQARVTFEVNLKAAQGAQLVLSSKLLRLATEVYQ